MPRRYRRLARIAPAVLAVTLAGALAGCGSSEEPEATPAPTSTTTAPTTGPATPTPTPTPTVAEPEATVVELDVADPEAGLRVKVAVGEEIVLRITSSQAGELHVHSSPEQELAFGAGTTDVTLVIDQPGIVDVEDHGTDALLVQLEVR